MQIVDSEQRAQALDPKKSFIVDSPAGSGKTELLIQRYLNLLGSVQRPEAVVAITFTRKAAGEMRRRIISALLNSAEPCPEKQHEALTWNLARSVRERSDALGWRLQDNPGRLRLQTIDSLCAAIVRQTPWLSRLGGPPDIAEDGKDLYAEAAQSILTLLEDDAWSSTVGSLLRHLDNNVQVLENLIAGMLAKRDQWLRYIAAADDPANNREALELSLRHVIEDAVVKARESIPPEAMEEIIAIASAAGWNLQTEGLHRAARACVDLTRLPDSDRMDIWQGIADTLLTNKGEWRKRLTIDNGFPPSDKRLKQRCVQLIADLFEKGVSPYSLDELRRLPDERFAEAQWQVLSALVKLLPVAVQQLRHIFHERGVADYVEVAIAARRSLGGPEETTDLARNLNLQIQHILIDEFQDTSVSQYSLLEALTSGWKPGDGRTIFAVGDPKQSIYRFREAEVGLFLKTYRDGVGAMPLQLIPLSVNFRSEKGIVDWVNNSFPGILSPEEDIASGAIPFRPSVPYNADEVSAMNPAVTIHPFIGRNDREEANRVVDIVRSALTDKQKKIAILVRSRSHLTHIIPALQAAGIRFRAVDIDPLADVPVIQDLTALTRALTHLADRIAWLAILRAPWCGMTLEELHTISGGDLKSAIWDLMRDESRLRLLSPEGRRRLNRVRSALEKALGKRPVSLRPWIEGVWLALGGPACTVETENAKAFFDLLDEMDKGGAVDIAALERRIQSLYANSDPEADESLQILSIHKAKGLEFDVVIAPGLGRKPRRDDSSLMQWLERPRLGGKTDLLLAPIHAVGAENDRTYDYLKRMDGVKSEHELGRLLYVAATRAKSALHLLGHAECFLKDGVSVLKDPASGSLLQRMWKVAEPEFRKECMKCQPPSANQTSNGKRKPQTMKRLPVDWEMPDLPPSVAGAGRSEPVDTEERVSFRWVGDTLRHIGTVVHQMLKRIADDGIPPWNSDRIHRNRSAYFSALSALGLPAAELPAAVDRVESALVQALSDDRGRWLLGPHGNASCEYSLCGVLEGRIVSARIDRTFIDEHGVRWIIDYKSSSHEGAGLEEFLDNERERYREQLARYRSLYGLLENRPVRTALYFPLLNAWREVD
jgi:ATP-dependent helicase/nuclease subunit A